MLNFESNEILTRVGADSAMGGLFRQFWQPALLAEELPEPDCPPVRVRLMGENFVAFRDSSGKVGLLDAHCPHRLAELYLGRNEEGGLRCVYHGWKFSVTGELLDMPSEPVGSPMRSNSKIRAKAYPVREAGGIVWAYLGPQDSNPSFPELEFMSLPAQNVYASKCLMKCNYQQALEGSLDTAHLTFLHRSMGPVEKDVFGVGNLQEYGDADGAPRFFCEDTDYGMRISARREGGQDTYYWRITQWLMPTCVLVPTAENLVCRANLFIPIDDENCWWYRVRYHVGRPLTDDELAEYRGGGLDYAKLIPGSYIPQGNRANDYLMDRGLQKGGSFTGIPSAQLQDLAVQESQGAIADRTKEHLGTSDTAIVKCRRRLIDSARKFVGEGTVPVAAARGELYKRRAVAMLLPQQVTADEAGSHPATVPNA
jgi:nitrite reductase/ring-hydroxylating ferredoxin subunit